MSGAQHPSDGIRSGRTPPKSTFLHTCNLLSQYLKGNISIRDLSHGISANSETAGKSEMSHSAATMDFFRNIQKSSQDPIPMAHNNDATITSKEAAKELPKAAQLTIFYSGKVMVFDQFPVDKARAVMLLASKGSPQSGCGIFETAQAYKIGQPSEAPLADLAKPVASPTTLPPPPSQPAGARVSGDLPIARRSSLHRFLEKRKDRATARAPYQVPNNPPLPSNNEGSSSSSKNEASSSKNQDHIDLNFKL